MLLINICQEFVIRIVNGRLGNDAHKGDITLYGKNEGQSVVDYFLATDNILTYIENFKIDTFDKLLYDVHCPISVTFNCANSIYAPSVSVGDPVVSSQLGCINIKFKWNNDNKRLFFMILLRIHILISLICYFLVKSLKMSVEIIVVVVVTPVLIIVLALLLAFIICQRKRGSQRAIE